MVHDTRLYDILAVSVSAPADEIARAYKKLALKYHPDKTNRDPELTEKFKDATRAYEILKDRHLRSVYDAYGESGLDGTYAESQSRSQPQPQPQPPSQGQPQGQPRQSRRHPQMFSPPFPFSPNNLFSQIFTDVSSAFGGSLPFGEEIANPFDFGPAAYNTQGMTRTMQPAPQEPVSARRGEDIHHTFNVLLADMYFGKVAKFLLPKMARCSTCKGIGCLDPRTCRVCKGSGRVVVTMMNQFSKFQEVGSCSPCHGTGIYTNPGAKCPHCDGGYLVEKKIIKVSILPGSKDGDRIILRGQSDEGRNIIPGDVVIHLQETPHPFLVRKFNDLYMEHDIDLRTAMLGGAIVVRDFLRDGHHLRILINAHGNPELNAAADPSINDGEVVGAINSGSPKIVKHLGMPINNDIHDGVVMQPATQAAWDVLTYDRGDLFIRFNVQIPALRHFSPADLEVLARTLPSAAPVASAAQTHHLANLPYDSANVRPPADLLDSLDLDGESKRKSDESSDEYDYDQLDIDSQGGDEEREDDHFYTEHWSKLEKKKRKRNTPPAEPFGTAPVGVSG